MKRLLFILALLPGAMVMAGCSGGGDAVSLIAPDAYVSQFEEAGNDHLLIDVRTPGEFANGHIPGAINIPVDQIASRLDEISTDLPVVVYCQSGNRSGRAAGILSQNEYDEIYDLGGILRWRSAGYSVE